MKGSALLILSVGLAVMLSCTKADVVQQHHKAVAAGYHKLPIARSMKERFAVWSFITHYNIPTCGYDDKQKTWNTITFIYGRYKLHFVQEVRLNKSGGQITDPIDEGKLLIQEIKRVHGEPYTPGTRFGDFQVWVDGDRLKQLVEADWDFAAIGIDLKTEPLENIDWLRQYYNRIYPLQTQAVESP